MSSSMMNSLSSLKRCFFSFKQALYFCKRPGLSPPDLKRRPIPLYNALLFSMGISAWLMLRIFSLASSDKLDTLARVHPAHLKEDTHCSKEDTNGSKFTMIRVGMVRNGYISNYFIYIQGVNIYSRERCFFFKYGAPNRIDFVAYGWSARMAALQVTRISLPSSSYWMRSSAFRPQIGREKPGVNFEHGICESVNIPACLDLRSRPILGIAQIKGLGDILLFEHV